MRKKGKYTEQFLRCISSKISNRSDCKGKSYEVTIESGVPKMFPIVYTYESFRHRKEADRLSLTDYAYLRIGKGDLIDGKYAFVRQGESKYRRWVKLY